MALLTVRDLSIELRGPKGSNVILPLLSFELDSGETLAIIGDSGAGKTTLLNVVAGFIRPARNGSALSSSTRALTEFLPADPSHRGEHLYLRGQVCINGGDVTTLPPQRRSVGMLMQSFSVFDDRTVLDNLTFKDMLRGLSREQRSRLAEPVFTQLGFDENAERVFLREASRLSGGEKQRVALGRLILERPTIWLLDEPYASLDVLKRERISREVHDQLHSLASDNFDVCALIVCHDLAETRRAHKLLVMADHHDAPQYALAERRGDQFVLTHCGPHPTPGVPLEKWLDRLKQDRVLAP